MKSLDNVTYQAKKWIANEISRKEVYPLISVLDSDKFCKIIASNRPISADKLEDIVSQLVSIERKGLFLYASGRSIATSKREDNHLDMIDCLLKHKTLSRSSERKLFEYAVSTKLLRYLDLVFDNNDKFPHIYRSEKSNITSAEHKILSFMLKNTMAEMLQPFLGDLMQRLVNCRFENMVLQFNESALDSINIRIRDNSLVPYNTLEEALRGAAEHRELRMCEMKTECHVRKFRFEPLSKQEPVPYPRPPIMSIETTSDDSKVESYIKKDDSFNSRKEVLPSAPPLDVRVDSQDDYAECEDLAIKCAEVGLISKLLSHVDDLIRKDISRVQGSLEKIMLKFVEINQISYANVIKGVIQGPISEEIVHQVKFINPEYATTLNLKSAR